MADYTFGVGEELQFTTQDTDIIHQWDFGDGTTSILSNPSHSYLATGIYTVTHSAKDFCDTCSIIGSHTIEITLASITVKSLLLDKYTAKVGDIITSYIIIQNLSPVHGTGSITLKFGTDIVGTYNVILDSGQETSITAQHQVIRSGIIDVCADNVCASLFVESQISVRSITVNPPISTGQSIDTTVEVTNNGTFTEEKEIKTTLTNTVTILVDNRVVTLAGGQSTIYTVPIDVRTLPNGTYTVCADGTCKAISIAIPAQTGNLNIVSYPNNAEVFLDGVDTGYKTPTTITDVLVGDHSFTLRLPGYNDTTGTITIQGGITSYIYTSLSLLSPTTGSISIQSTPTGAEIFLAPTGQSPIDQQQITPATITDLSPGNYDILLRLSGYQDYFTTIPIIAGQTTYLSVTLLQQPILVGSINFTSVPAGAEIFLAPTGQPLVDKGIQTPRTMSNIDIGDYDFRLTLSGYNDVVGRISVVGGLTSYVFATLVSTTPTTGSLAISSIPQGADIYLNDVKRTETTPATITDLSPGSYTITLKKTGYNDLTINANVNAGQTTYIGVTLVIKVVMGMFPWWLIIGLAVGSFLQKRKGMYEIDGKVPISLPPTKKAIVEQKDNILILPTTEIVNDKRKKLIITPRGPGKEPGETFIENNI